MAPLLGNYLCLPSQNDRNKNRMFNQVKDRVSKTLQGWKGTFFSVGDKKVLIKSVAQAIPGFVMFSFKLPEYACLYRI